MTNSWLSCTFDAALQLGSWSVCEVISLPLMHSRNTMRDLRCDSGIFHANAVSSVQTRIFQRERGLSLQQRCRCKERSRCTSKEE